MAIALSNPQKLSLTEFLAMPETKPANEFIDGQIYQKIMPQGKHSRLQTKFASLINERGEPNCLVSAFCELRCTLGGRSIVPDISVFEWQNIPLDEYDEPLDRIEIAPDWVIEILSPDQSTVLIIDKIRFALKHGSKLGWLIAPNERKILTFSTNEFDSYQGNDILPMLGILKDWQLSVNDVFNLLIFTKS
ncbi:Uma2 family endonuclease [Pseudanabaena sp. Chao 1811]|uniref:Uma2 family endonuclease n=1 Tax=Pseudanabaena sp. Chao 1811 TaxID=2963092 RepID=UPI0022F3EF8C|nr:Uma2 family endonuclease [Pseudanabaena sp. Chao 1811]